VPVDVVGPEYLVASVTAGSAFACVVKYPGRASCWGLNDSGQLGDGTLLQRPLPVDVLTEVKPTPPKTPVEVVEGDANCDERVDSIDAAVVLQFSAGLLKEAPCSFSADANDDFSVDSRDATLILQHVAGLVVL